MQRDGATQSLWQSNVPDHADSGSMPDRPVDVLIVGGGITGLGTALRLQQMGKSCIVAESHSLCYGTTGGTTAHLNTFFDTTYDIVESDFSEDAARLLHTAARSALDLVKRNIAELGIDCGHSERDGYVYAQTADQEHQLDKMFQASVNAGAEVEYTDQIPVPFPFRKAIVYRRQAQFHPTRYVMALAKAFVAAGGRILQGCRVEQFDKVGELLSVHTSRGDIQAHWLIWATHIPPGINLLHFRNAPYRSYALALTLDNDQYPEGLAYDLYDPYHYFRTQEVDGRRYLIAGGEDHKTAHVTNTDQCFFALEAYVRNHFAVGEVAFRWSSQYYEPADGLPYIGHLPGNPEKVLVATGYSGNGMTYSHIAAMTLTDLIVKGDSGYASLFAPGRVKPVAGFMDFVKENADVVAQFVGKRIKTEKLRELADLAPGEGRLVKFEGHNIALYKNDAGKLFALNPVCTHAKCVVDWNRAEQSWDCPCHGARYSVTGDVLTGPARANLEQIDLEDL
ncbi:FAD-dependent oxidoreductase [Flaviaesturariibacter flavus]|uniref:FAD-dependent oxidoreductase n=1 Tax=Flaviaesturariibacter flavus TaxID=2502780 RepID=A0A4R1B9H6_9BACT|nr:FAD-dependent oxidoreductase [Flaviaesturariibacter flavus]TCJ13553.1 FAD-dependent oxidoreductase [Flaviaesturariibacter flavus]